MIVLAACAQAPVAPTPQEPPHLRKFIPAPPRALPPDVLIEKLEKVQRDVEWLHQYTAPKDQPKGQVQ